MECDFCKKKFTTIYSLKNHKTTAKYCLKIQNKSQNEKFKCDYCEKIFTSKYGLGMHLRSCKDMNIIINTKDKDIIIAKQESIIEEFRKQEEKYKQQFEKQEEQLKKKLKQKLEKQEEKYKQQLKKQEEQIKELQDKLERIATTAVSKPTTTNNHNTKITFIAPLDLSHDRITNIVSSKLSGDHIVDGMAGIAKFVKDEIITQEGNLLYECVDPSRHIYKYKNDKGELVKDKRATKLIGAIQPALKEKTNDLFFEYKDKITNFVPDEEDKKNIFNKKDVFMYLKDEALKIHGDISDMHKNTRFSAELSNQVTK